MSLVLTPSQDVDRLSDEDVLALTYDWSLWARDNQQIPEGDWWVIWLLMAGRGFGKTRTGAEFVRHFIETKQAKRIALIGPTAADARDVMVEGESGLLATAPKWNRPLYEPSKRRLTWPSGAQAFLYSAEEPERLRGPQHDLGWCDELGAWQYVQETWDMYQFGLRLGRHPRTAITTTPRPIPLLRKLLKRKDIDLVLTSGSTYENKDNLASAFFTQVAQYEGTRLGRQELHAEMINPEEAGIIQKSWIKKWPATKALPRFEFILQSYDTAYTERTVDTKTKERDPSACTTWGVFSTGASSYGIMLLDSWTDYLGYPELRSKLLREFKEASYQGRTADFVLIEDKGSGISLRQDLSSQVPIRPYNPGKADKLARLHYVSHLFKHGLVYIPESTKNRPEFTSWSMDLIEQLTCFPEVEHDDLVDTTTQALAYCKDLGYLTVDVETINEVARQVEPNNAKRNPYG